ncbi:Membrane-associated guanylate kinase, WW and PDZ domain-containing protein 3 [Takifugu flavidus]|uniref:Membrane-associated guanylate kinase, WW and PDZ domain-containing protein 3 n=1 Tax=Takifugu flavidus TaxID=433684 RepID=A0A5C6MQK7_9TELE|nr:Membrane-associated guanylate kinase, WW and PDZ domain-containing protein 3 [Takifugu flavidus]
MSKTALKKQHWRSHVQDSFIPLLGSSGELGIAVGGGADYGEFPFVTSALGGGLTVGDIVLEIGGTPVLGMTLGDVRGVLNSCPHPIRIKTVSPGFTLCKDLRLYLSKCFTPGSVDSQLQQVIRENLYLRALPCTTRQPRDGEIAGVDYNFVSIEEFFSLEESGALLESGKFKGNYYGTPRPVHVSADSPPITYQEHRNLLRNFRTRSKSLSNLEKAAEDGDNSEEDSGEYQSKDKTQLLSF